MKVPAQDLMVWILRSKTRTLAKWVMSPANLNIFIFFCFSLLLFFLEKCNITKCLDHRNVIFGKCKDEISSDLRLIQQPGEAFLDSFASGFGVFAI